MATAHRSLGREIIANLLLTFLLYTAINIYVGQRFLPYETAKTCGVQPTELGERLGLSRGDKIIAIDGKAYEHFDNIHGWIAKGTPHLHYHARRCGA